MSSKTEKLNTKNGSEDEENNDDVTFDDVNSHPSPNTPFALDMFGSLVYRGRADGMLPSSAGLHACRCEPDAICIGCCRATVQHFRERGSKAWFADGEEDLQKNQRIHINKFGLCHPPLGHIEDRTMPPDVGKEPKKQSKAEAMNIEPNTKKAEGQSAEQKNDEKASRIEKIRRARRRRLD